MDRRETRPMVLARIPNLNSSRANKSPEEPPASSGRILGQAFSFKVLAGVTLLLVAVAIVPLTFKRDTPSSAPKTTAEAWDPGAPTASADTAPAWLAPVAKTPASPPPMRDVLPEPSVASVTPASASLDEPLMSTWPNPSQPTSPQAEAGAEEPRAGVNQSMAIRPSESIRK